MTEDELQKLANDDWEVFKNEKGQLGLKQKNQPQKETRSERLEFRLTPSMKLKLQEVSKKEGSSAADVLEHALQIYFNSIANVEDDIRALDNSVVDYIIKWQNEENPTEKEKDFVVFLNDLHEKMTDRFEIQPDLSGLTEFEMRELGFID